MKSCIRPCRRTATFLQPNRFYCQRLPNEPEYDMTELLSVEVPQKLENNLREFLRNVCERELRLATAESCTGGLIASLLTDMEGVSHVFERSFVVYSDEAKREMLGVPAQSLDEYGAVSKEVAIHMAEGALSRSRADIALSVTGFAGPPPGNEEEGLVHFACACKGMEPLHKEIHCGAVGRTQIRLISVEAGLELMNEALRKTA